MGMHNIITVTDFSIPKNTEAYVSEDGYTIVPGDIDVIKQTHREEDSLNGITAMVFDRYMHWRFAHAVVLTISDYELFRKYFVSSLDQCMQSLMDYYTLDHDVFMLNLIGYQVWHEDEREINADNTVNMFKRWDFIDVGCTIRNRYKVNLIKDGDYLEIKEEPNDESITLYYVANKQLINIKKIPPNTDLPKWLELVDGGYVKSADVTPYNVDIKKYVSIRCNGIGDAGITGNFSEIW